MTKIIDSHAVAIVTKYHGPTNTRGSRISADAGMKRRVSVYYDHSLSGVDVHAVAARALCEKFGWKGDLIAGGTESGYVFVFARGIES